MVEAGHYKISVKWYKQGTIVILITFILFGDTFQNCKKKKTIDLNRQWTNTTLKKTWRSILLHVVNCWDVFAVKRETN